MATIQDILLGDFDMTRASKSVQYASADALALYLETHTFDKAEAKQVARFMKEIDDIPRVRVWASLQAKVENLFMIHPLIQDLMVKAVHAPSRSEEFNAFMKTEHGPERDAVLKQLGYVK